LIFELTLSPPLFSNVDAAFNPRKFGARSRNEFETVRMAKVEMANHCAILVDPASSEDFIESTVDFSKGYWTTCSDTRRALIACRI
jgi:hypothetical protein